MIRMTHATALTCAMLLPGCVPTGNYQPPQPPQSLDYSRDVNASFDTTWSTITSVAGATFFNIKNFDKGSGLMTLSYDNLRGNVGSYVTCGEYLSSSSAFTNTHSNPKSAVNFMAYDVQMHLSGHANVTARPVSDNKSTIQINSNYTLTITHTVGDKIETVGVWHFTSREPDTQSVNVAYVKTSVTCQTTNKLEHDFLTEVTARLPSNAAPEPLTKEPSTSKKRSRK